MIRIGYQGEVCSNSEEAAYNFVSNFLELKSDEYELVPLIESRYVASNIKLRKIDYGVMAIRNSIAGTVNETYEALKDKNFQSVTTIVLPIHHCIFIKQNSCEEKIDTITSHIQALNQTSKTRKAWHPEWKEIESNDTASAARNLAENIFPDSYAVICRKNAGEQYNLKLLRENAEDVKNNTTEFGVYKLSDMI